MGMGTGTLGEIGEMAPEMRGHGTAMAEIVREMLSGGPDRLRDDAWLRARAAASGLDCYECVGLEALRVRLRDGRGDGMVLPDAGPTTIWL